MLDMAKVTADLAEITSAEDKFKYFEKIVEQMDKDDENNERRHKSHRADFDITVLDRGTDEEHKCIPSEFTRIRFSEPLLDQIFSKRFEDLHELPHSEIVSGAISEMPDNYKEILFLKAVQKLTQKEIAEIKGVSQSSVSQLYKKAIKYIHFLIEVKKSSLELIK